MKNNKYAPIRNGLFAITLLALAGCAATPPGMFRSSAADRLPAGTPAAPAQAASAEVEPYDDETAAWDGIDGTLFPPDPEHSTVETEPELALQEGGATWIDSSAAGGSLPEDAPDAYAPDLWDRMRAGFDFPQHDNQRVRAELDWYASHPDYLDRTVERARPYLYIIIEELHRRDMPMEIALLPIVESAYQPLAYSRGRAAGIWQFIPGTAQHYGLKLNWWYDGRRDILASTRAALDFLQALHDDLDNDWLLALAAYNSGAGTVKRAIKTNERHGRPTDFWSLQLPAETRAYVPKLLALAELFANPEDYSLAIRSIPDEQVVRSVGTGSQIDLAKAAELSDISLDELYRLNPAFNRWATDPDGPHELLLPLDKASLFETKLATLDAADRVTWQRYIIRSGDSLGTIAKRHHTTVEVLRQFNNIKGNVIRAGHALLIPASARSLSVSAPGLDARGQTAQTGPRTGGKFVYAVRSGDTLWNIARRHDVELKHLAQWNGISPRDPLRIGQRLTIWRDSGAAAGLNAQPPLGNTTQRINYVVRKGDSLARISQRFNVKVSELRDWNSLRKNQHLQPGQKLTLYIDVIHQTENI